MVPPRRAQLMGVKHTEDWPDVGMRRHTPRVNEGLHGVALRWRSSGRGYFPLVQFLPPITPAGPPCAHHHCAAAPRACPTPASQAHGAWYSIGGAAPGAIDGVGQIWYHKESASESRTACGRA